MVEQHSNDKEAEDITNYLFDTGYVKLHDNEKWRPPFYSLTLSSREDFKRVIKEAIVWHNAKWIENELNKMRIKKP